MGCGLWLVGASCLSVLLLGALLPTVINTVAQRLHVPSELEPDHVEIGTYRTYYYTSEQIAQCATLKGVTVSFVGPSAVLVLKVIPVNEVPSSHLRFGRTVLLLRTA